MKRLVMVALFLVVASVPAYANIDCYSYYNNLPGQYWYTNFCYESPGNICYQCVDVQAGTGCADKTLCNPNEIYLGPDVKYAELSSAQRAGRVEVAAARRAFTSRSGHSDSIRPVSPPVARLNPRRLPFCSAWLSSHLAC